MKLCNSGLIWTKSSKTKRKWEPGKRPIKLYSKLPDLCLSSQNLLLREIKLVIIFRSTLPLNFHIQVITKSCQFFLYNICKT